MVVRMMRRAFAVAYVPAGLAFIVIVCAGIYAGYLNRSLHAQSMRAEVQTKINLIRAKLEGHISANIQLVRGLAATIETEPDMGQARFSAWRETCSAKRHSCATSPARLISSSR